MSTHYVANIKIDKVEKTDPRSVSGEVKRDVVETVNITIKAETFSRLQEKIAAHVSIMDEEDL